MKTFKDFIKEVSQPTGKLKDACWTGYTAVGTKKKNGKTVPNCVPEEVELEEIYHDPWKDKHFGPTKVIKQKYKVKTDTKTYDVKADSKNHAHKLVTNHAPGSKIVSIEHKGRFMEQVEEMDETAAWQKKSGKNPEGGLNQKGVDSYRRENPGSKLQTAVTTPPSKLDPDSKSAKRRKSFCSRMSGMKAKLTSASTANDPDSRINKSLRKWNCR